jgi:hypothetical protein
MNKLLLIALALALASALPAAAQQQFSYSKVVELNSSSKIELQNIEDFARIARDNKIKDIFYTDKYFAYSLNSSLYQFQSNGYSSIDDYLAGQRTKFPNGRLYYLALGNKLKTAEEVQYFDREYYLSGDDYRKAQAAGFVGKAEAEKVKKFYGLMTKAALAANLKAAAWVCFVLSSENSPGDAKGFNTEPDPEKIAAWSKGAFKKMLGDSYLMDMSIDEKARSKGSSKDAEAQKRPFFQSDAILYYLASIAQYQSYEQFSKRNLKQPTNVVGNDRILEGLKMVNIEELGQAMGAGYSNGDEYRLGKFYELKNKAEYEAHKAFISKLEEQRVAYGLKNRDQAALAYVLRSLQAGIPISVDVFVEKANVELLGNPELVAMRFKKTNAKGVDALFAANARLADEVGYSADAKTILRKSPPNSYPPSK